MNRYYDEKEIKYYIEKHGLYDLIPNIWDFDKSRFHLIKSRKGEHPIEFCDSDVLIFLVEGSVKNCARTKNGKRILMHISEDFEILKDLEMLHIENMEMEIETIKNAVFLEFNLKGIRDKIVNDPKFLYPMLEQVAKKLSNTTIAQTMIATYNLENRLSSYIIHMASEKFDGKLVFNENLVETAELLCTSYRLFLRVLREFCDKGVLENNKGEYVVIDLDKLMKLASDRPIYGKFH